MTRDETGRTGSEGARVVGSLARVTHTKSVRGFGSGRLERLAIIEATGFTGHTRRPTVEDVRRDRQQAV
jgi:hypothetical protein